MCALCIGPHLTLKVQIRSQVIRAEAILRGRWKGGDEAGRVGTVCFKKRSKVGRT
jgi:hypothetical protein